MSGVFRNIDPPTPSPPGECVPPRLLCGWRTQSLGGEGVVGGFNSSEDARHCSVLYILTVSTLWEGLETRKTISYLYVIK
jgi:hypothetical protein